MQKYKIGDIVLVNDRPGIVLFIGEQQMHDEGINIADYGFHVFTGLWYTVNGKIKKGGSSYTVSDMIHNKCYGIVLTLHPLSDDHLHPIIGHVTDANFDKTKLN